MQSSFPPLCFLDVPNGQERKGRSYKDHESRGSFSNEQEAQIVADLIDILIASGLEADDIGVITPYKSQAFRVSQLIPTSGYVFTSQRTAAGQTLSIFFTTYNWNKTSYFVFISTSFTL